LTNDPATFSLTLILRDGVRVDSKPDGTAGKASTFGESKLPLEVVAPEPFRTARKESELSLWELVRAHVEEWPGLGKDDVVGGAQLSHRPHPDGAVPAVPGNPDGPDLSPAADQHPDRRRHRDS